ncbi:hypothetical protein Tco_1192010 [Tanacetum coccineum]
MESVKKSIGERAQHKMQYERRVNERQIQTTEEKTDTSNVLDALDAKPWPEGTNDYHDNVSAIRTTHTEQPEFINEGEVDQNAETMFMTYVICAKLTDNMTTNLDQSSSLKMFVSRRLLPSVK